MAKRPKSEKERKRNQEYQKEYYRKNRERLLKKRKEKYANDPKYRAATRERDQRNYWLKRRSDEAAREVPSITLEEINPSGTIEVPLPRHLGGYGRKVAILVYGTSKVGEIVGRKEQTIRKWLSSGVLPEPAWRGDDLPSGHSLRRGRNRRWYSPDEMAILASHRELLRRPAASLQDAPYFIRVQADFMKLVAGLAPETWRAHIDEASDAGLDGIHREQVARGVADFITREAAVVPRSVRVRDDGLRPTCEVVLDPENAVLTGVAIDAVKRLLPANYNLTIMLFADD